VEYDKDMTFARAEDAVISHRVAVRHGMYYPGRGLLTVSTVVGKDDDVCYR